MTAPRAGIDRWRGGWIVARSVVSPLDEEGERSAGSAAGTRCAPPELWAAATIDEALERLEHCEVVAIDMPLALVESGTRQAEHEVRGVLGRSARSVFTSPTRAAVDAESQAHATEINRDHGGPGISAQAFGLFASIRELRSSLHGDRFHHWWETHPETAFTLMNRGTPPASKRSALGVGQRLRLLGAHYWGVDELLLASPEKVPVDDVLDAVAALWSAERIGHDSCQVYGPAGRDDQGFPLGIRI